MLNALNSNSQFSILEAAKNRSIEESKNLLRSLESPPRILFYHNCSASIGSTVYTICGTVSFCIIPHSISSIPSIPSNSRLSSSDSWILHSFIPASCVTHSLTAPQPHSPTAHRPPPTASNQPTTNQHSLITHNSQPD